MTTRWLRNATTKDRTSRVRKALVTQAFTARWAPFAGLPLLLACGTSNCGASSQPAAQSASSTNAPNRATAAALAGAPAKPPSTGKDDDDDDDEKGVVPFASSADGVAPLSNSAGGRHLTFDVDSCGKPPESFSFARTEQGALGRWVVQREKDAPSAPNVLAQLDSDGTDYRFPVAVTDGPSDPNVVLSVRCKPVSGNVDRACGLVFRYVNEDNYYVTRANALENNVRLYHVVNGRRAQFAGWNGTVSSGVWHELRVDAKGDKFQVYWDRKKVIDATIPMPVALGDGAYSRAHASPTRFSRAQEGIAICLRVSARSEGEAGNQFDPSQLARWRRTRGVPARSRHKPWRMPAPPRSRERSECRPHSRTAESGATYC